jgi:hypothetical protein
MRPALHFFVMPGLTRYLPFFGHRTLKKVDPGSSPG